MALPPNFPESPHAILAPNERWEPGRGDLFEMLPPLVSRLREAVEQWRAGGYQGASQTSRSLLRWWFGEEHWQPGNGGAMQQFRYYFAQQEAVETVLYLLENPIHPVREPLDLLRFDSSGEVSTGRFDEDWRRFVIKMATGSGKTKVMSLLLAWSYFHKLYEPSSGMARNFLVIAPNIIVLDRLWRDFAGLRIFHADPVLPENGVDGRDWRSDFQLSVHRQDDVRAQRPTGNIFLTNIHRVYSGEDAPPSPDDADTTDYFLGKRPTGATTDSKVDLGAIVRDIDELAVFNDEAHHIHDKKLAWFAAIRDIHNRLLQRGGALSLQVDTSATPRHSDGGVFVQTVADYPLVEAISQNVVKHPVLPDAESRAKLVERQTVKYTERYADHLELGVVEWRKTRADHGKLGKKAILFVMTDDTKNCDEVAEYLGQTYEELEGRVLVIHTKRNGEISESATGRNLDELRELRRQANEIDGSDNPYQAIVSVMMLKEGWDVRNVTAIVGLRAYTAKSNILPEQTLGRGLRRMYPNSTEPEKLSVVGTPAFMDFVEEIEKQGVTLERVAMGAGAPGTLPMLIEVERGNPQKNLAQLDIALPELAPRLHRDYQRLDHLNPANFAHEKLPCRRIGDSASRTIVFHYAVTEEFSHTTELGAAHASDFRAALRFFARTLHTELRLVDSHALLYEKLKEFVRSHLFTEPVELEAENTLRNLAESSVTRLIIETFKREINQLLVQDRGGLTAEIRRTLHVCDMQPFRTKRQEALAPKKSAQNWITGDHSGLELRFAEFLDGCADIISFAKNYHAIGFRLDYINPEGEISSYTPDFLVKKSAAEVFIIETKGREDPKVPLQMQRLRQWCQDANAAQSKLVFGFVYVEEERFAKYPPENFAALIRGFRGYQGEDGGA